MKILNVAALVACVSLAALGSAQRPPMGGPGGPRGGGMGMGRPPMDPKQRAEFMTARMTETLGLNPAQQAKVKAIMLRSAIESKKILDAQNAALKKVLTPAQFAKLPMGRGMGRGMGMGRPGGPGMGGPGGMRRGG